MFWSLILEPGKRYSSTVKESFHLSMATLDVKSCKNDSEIHPVSIEVEGEELLLCNLSKSTSPHASLDLMFQKGSEITFFTKGKATVHLTGYCLQEDISDDDDDYDSFEDDEEVESNDKIEFSSAKSELADKTKNKDKQKANKRKLESNEAVSKKKHKGGKSESEDDDDDDNDSDDLSGDLDDSKLDQLMDSINAEDDSSDENDEDDSDVEDEDSDDSEGEVGEDEDDEDGSDSEGERGQKHKKKQEVKTPVSSKQKTPASNKKQEKQNKHEFANGTTPQSNKNKNQTNQQTPKQAALKTPNKDGQKTPKKGESTPQSQKKTLNGGVVVEELKPGSGQPAKYGKIIQVYYTGRLKNNNRVFDQSTEGPGFKFRLGNNEVIKGWDVALNGMKVGGKRRITIPPAMAYGSKGSPPQIPPNSWLVFDVELKSVN